MTDRKDSPSKGSERVQSDAAAPKRPHATLDLKATEVKAAEPPTPTTGAPTGTNADAAARVAAAAARVGGSSGATGSSKDASPGKATAAAAATASPRASAETAPTPKAAAAGYRASQGQSSGSGIGRFFTHMAAGLLGGALTLLGGQQIAGLIGLDLPHAGTSASVPGTPPSEIATRLAALERAAKERPTTAVGSGDAADLEAARKQIEALTRTAATLGEAQRAIGTELAALKSAASQGGGVDGTRLAKIEEQLATMAAAAKAEPDRAGRLPQLAQLTGKIADLEAALSTRLTEMRRDFGRDIDTRLAAAAEASEAAKSGAQRLDREMATIRSDGTRLSERLTQIKSGSDRLEQTLKAVQEETGSLKTALEGLRGELERQLKTVAKPADVAAAVQPVAGRVANLEASLQGVVKAEADRRSNAERIVLALELGNLKRAMERGIRYAPELAEVKKAAGSRLDLKPLEPYQNQGVPTVAELVLAFRPIAGQILDADAEQSDASVVDRLLTGARSIVRVRKTSYAASDTSTEATVARLEAALRDGRLGEVVSEAGKLSPKAAAPARDWLAKVTARQAVDKAIAAIDAQLKSSLGATSAPASTKGTQ